MCAKSVLMQFLKIEQLSLNHFHFFPYQELTNPPRNAFFYFEKENQVRSV